MPLARLEPHTPEAGEGRNPATQAPTMGRSAPAPRPPSRWDYARACAVQSFRATVV